MELRALLYEVPAVVCDVRAFDPLAMTLHSVGKALAIEARASGLSAFEQYKRKRKLSELEQLLDANYKRGDRLTASELEQLANKLKEMVDTIKNARSERSGEEPALD